MKWEALTGEQVRREMFGEGKTELTVAQPPALGAFHVVVDFGHGIHHADQGMALLALEQWFRERGIPAEVFKRTMPDDLKSRRDLTAEERKKL